MAAVVGVGKALLLPGLRSWVPVEGGELVLGVERVALEAVEGFV